MDRYIKNLLRPRSEWSVVHEAAAFGQPTLLKYALIVEPNVLTANPISPLHVAVSNVVIPNSLYSIQEFNNKLYIYQRAATESSSVNSVIEITPGNYSASALNAALQTKLNAAALGSALPMHAIIILSHSVSRSHKQIHPDL